MDSSELYSFGFGIESGLLYVVVHLFDGHHLVCQDYHVQVGVDFDPSLDYVECVFIEPHTTVYAIFPDFSGSKFLEVLDEL